MSAPDPADLVRLMPYAVSLGVRFEEATPALTRASVEWSAELQTELVDDEGRAVAHATQTQAVLAPR